MPITCVKVAAQTDSIGLKADPYYNADCLKKVALKHVSRAVTQHLYFNNRIND